MENAVKALLIAGAVLIVILLITLAMNIFNTGSESSGDANSSIESADSFAFNQRFTPYLGNSVSGSSTKNLITQVLHNNLSVESSTFSPGEHVYLNYYPKSGTSTTHQFTASQLQSLSTKISNGKKYIVQLTGDCSASNSDSGYYNGHIVCISIWEK